MCLKWSDIHHHNKEEVLREDIKPLQDTGD